MSFVMVLFCLYVFASEIRVIRSAISVLLLFGDTERRGG